MIQLLESITRNMATADKVMLTCFRHNMHALRFYTKMGYLVDESSPSPRKLRNGTIVDVDYMILSKDIES